MSGQLSFEEFKKFDFRVGTVESVDVISGDVVKATVRADRLYTTILEGGFKEAQLAGKMVAILANFKPREIRGIKCDCLALIVDEGGKPVIVSPDKGVKNGAKVF